MATINISLNVLDQAVLYAEAKEIYMEQNLGRDPELVLGEFVEFCGDAENVKVDQCLRAVFDSRSSCKSFEVLDSYVEV
jgi:hypothetical protein